MRSRVRFSISGSRSQHLAALAGIGDVAGDGRAQHRAEILRGVGQRGVRADRDALHALRAVLGDVERRLAARDVLGRRVAGARGHDAQGRRAAWPAGCSRSRSGTRRRTRDEARERRTRGLALGRRCASGSRRRRSSRRASRRPSRATGSSGLPRSVERSAASSSPILISCTRSKPCVMTSMLEFTTASPSLPNFFTYCLWTDVAELLLA